MAEKQAATWVMWWWNKFQVLMIPKIYNLVSLLQLQITKGPQHMGKTISIQKVSQPPEKRKKIETFQSSMLQLEKKKLEILKNRSEDENDDCRQFMMSLVPSMRMRSQKNQCVFRMKVQQLVLEALHGNQESFFT